jgi:uncharacterized protein (TIGR02145 family)
MFKKLLLFLVIITTSLFLSSVALKKTEKFKSVKIGKQIWMVKNLDVVHYRNGDPIPEVKDPKAWASLSTGAWCYYDNDSVNGKKYGKLYNWYAVNDPRGLAPEGWHVPSDAEWKELSEYLGGDKIAGGKMKSKGTGHWIKPNKGATNKSGFSALPGGYRYNDGIFGNLGFHADWCSSTEDGKVYAWDRDMDFDNAVIGRGIHFKGDGLYVRCIKD